MIAKVNGTLKITRLTFKHLSEEYRLFIYAPLNDFVINFLSKLAFFFTGKH